MPPGPVDRPEVKGTLRSGDRVLRRGVPRGLSRARLVRACRRDRRPQQARHDVVVKAAEIAVGTHAAAYRSLRV